MFRRDPSAVQAPNLFKWDGFETKDTLQYWGILSQCEVPGFPVYESGLTPGNVVGSRFDQSVWTASRYEAALVLQWNSRIPDQISLKDTAVGPDAVFLQQLQ